MTKSSAAEAVAFLTEVLRKQESTSAGLNCARVLIHCLRDVASPQGLLSAGIDFLQTLLHSPKLEVNLPNLGTICMPAFTAAPVFHSVIPTVILKRDLQATESQ